MRNVFSEKYLGKFMSEGVFLPLIIPLVIVQRLVSQPKDTSFLPVWGKKKKCGFLAESSDF